MREPDHHGNELQSLCESISRLSVDLDQTISWTVARSVRQIINEHGHFLTAQSAPERAPYLWAKAELGSEQAARAAVKKLEEKIPLFPRDNTAKMVTLYCSPKDWVSGGGRARMMEGLQTMFQLVIGSYLTECAADFKLIWEKIFKQESNSLRSDVACEIDSYYLSQNAALNSEIDTDSLEEIRLRLTKLLSGKDLN